MKKPIDRTDVEAASRALIRATKTNLGIEVTMPVIYPDGEAVTVVVTVEGGGYLVHDAGFGAMYLTNAGVNFTRQLRDRLASLAHHYGCDFIDGRMSRRCTAEQVALAVAMVANASRTIGDQALEIRHRAASEFSRAVVQSAREKLGTRLRAQEEVEGASGRHYRVDALILDTQEKSRVAFIESVPTRSTVAARFTEFSDLRDKYSSVRRFAIYNENDKLPPTDRKLLEKVSEVLPYGNSGEWIARELAA